MGFIFLLKGVVIGLVASVPLGPIGVMCIQRTLSKNRRSGFVSGLGAASADTLFAAVALFSLTVVLAVVQRNLEIIKVLAGISIIIVGMIIFLKNPVVQIKKNRAGQDNLWSDYISVFFVTLANPSLILIFVALFAALGVSQAGLRWMDSIPLLGGVLCGAALWWFGLTLAVNFLRSKFRPRHLLWLNRISGAVIVVLGIAVILSIFINITQIYALPT